MSTGATLTFAAGKTFQLGYSDTARAFTFTGDGKTVIKSNIVDNASYTAANTITIGSITRGGLGTTGLPQYISSRSYSDVTFTGTNTYKGNTTLAAESHSKLTVNGDNSDATGTITVQSTCLLTGNGTVNAVTVAAGTTGGAFIVQDSVAYDNGQGSTGGTISGNLTLKGNLTFQTLANANGSNAAFYGDSLLTLTNNATLAFNAPNTTGADITNSVVTFQFLGNNWHYSGTGTPENWLIIDLTGASNASATSIANLGSVDIFAQNFQGTAGALSLQFLKAGEGVDVTGIYLVGGYAVPIPEPSTWLLLGAGVAFMAFTRRGRR